MWTGELMVSTPYFRGRSREYQVLHTLRKKGWLCSRSAASHGPVDVFAAKNGRVLIIQVKSGSARFSQKENKVLRDWAKAYNARAEIWRFRHRKIEKEVIYDQELPSRNRNQLSKTY